MEGPGTEDAAPHDCRDGWDPRLGRRVPRAPAGCFRHL